MDTILFEKQTVVDSIINRLADALLVPRHELGVIASPKGLALGKFTIKHEEAIIDFAHKPTLISTIPGGSEILASPRIVLVVEKEAVFNTIAQNIMELSLRVPDLLIVTGRGYPCMLTMTFVNYLYKNLAQTKFYVLVDYDPYGLDIAIRYKRGSKLQADQETTNCPNISFLGLKRWQLDRYSDQMTIDNSRRLLTKKELKRLERLKKNCKMYDWPELVTVAEELIEGGFSTELESLYKMNPNILLKFIIDNL